LDGHTFEPVDFLLQLLNGTFSELSTSLSLLVDWRRKRVKNGKLVICLGFSREIESNKKWLPQQAGVKGDTYAFLHLLPNCKI